MNYKSLIMTAFVASMFLVSSAALLCDSSTADDGMTPPQSGQQYL